MADAYAGKSSLKRQGAARMGAAQPDKQEPIRIGSGSLSRKRVLGGNLGPLFIAWSPGTYISMIFVAMFLQKSLSCSTKRIVGANSRISSSIWMRE